MRSAFRSFRGAAFPTREAYVATYRLPKPNQSRSEGDLPDALQAAFKHALEAARAEGREEARQAVMATLDVPAASERAVMRPRTSGRRSGRAEEKVRQVVMATHGGLLLHQLIGQVMAKDGRLKEGTIRAEVHTGDGVLYRAERGRWHLIDPEPAGRHVEVATPPTMVV